MMIYLVALAFILFGGSNAVVFEVKQRSDMVRYNGNLKTGEICASMNKNILDPCKDPKRASFVMTALREKRLGMRGQVINSCRTDRFKHVINGIGANNIGDARSGNVNYPVKVNGRATTVRAFNFNITWFINRQGQAPGAKVRLFFYFFSGSGQVQFLGERGRVFPGMVEMAFEVKGWKFCEDKKKDQVGRPKGTCPAWRRGPGRAKKDRTVLEVDYRAVYRGGEPLVARCHREVNGRSQLCSFHASSVPVPLFKFMYFTGVKIDGRRDCMPFQYPMVRDCLNPKAVSYFQRFGRPRNVNNKQCSSASVVVALPKFKRSAFYDPCACVCAGMIPTLGLSLLPVVFINIFYSLF